MPEAIKSTEVLRKIADFLRTLTDDQIDDVITGKVKLTLTSSRDKRVSVKPRSIDESDIIHIREELVSKHTREEGIALLDNLELTRESLKDIAVAMDLPTPKTDTVSRLKDRIVEATIGYRLRSNAIRSRD